MLVGVIGKKRSGKDTIGNYLVNNKNFIKYNFADPIKRGAMQLFGFTSDQVFEDLKDVVDPKWGVTPRKVLQILGTEIFQYDMPKHIPELEKFGRGFWIERFKQWYQLNKSSNVVICDVRFQHEADAIIALGGIILQVERTSDYNTDEHPSEKEMDLIDVPKKIIKNDGTLNQLYDKVETWFISYFSNKIRPF